MSDDIPNGSRYEWQIWRNGRLYDSSEYRGVAMQLARTWARDRPGDTFGIRKRGEAENQIEYRVEQPA